MNPLTELKQIPILSLLIAVALACPAVLPNAHALSPAPDGGYAGGNTAEGQNALFSLGTGMYNTAIGWSSLYNNVTSQFNTAVGASTLFNNTGSANTAVGAAAMFFNTTGNGCTAVGTNALRNNTTGLLNTATGSSALYSNTTGLDNTANGPLALYSNTTGSDNTAVGSGALEANNGYRNTAVGQGALFNNFDGYKNTAVGSGAGVNLRSGGNLNVYVGWDVPGVDGDVGHTYISNIRTTVQPVTSGVESVTVRLSDGLLGHTSSSARYKEEIKPMADASELLYRLKPVTYRYKNEIDPSRTLDYGLVAEEVAKVDSKLAIHNGKGEIESVRYQAINAMLLNEFLKEHRKVKELETIVGRQQKGIDALRVGLQKMSAQIELGKRTPEIAINHQ